MSYLDQLDHGPYEGEEREFSPEEAGQMDAISTAITGGWSEVDEVDAWEIAYELGYAGEA